MSKIQIIKYIFIAVSIVSNGLFWFVVQWFVNTNQKESWLMPIILLAIVFVSWSLVVVLSINRREQIIWYSLLVFPIISLRLTLLNILVAVIVFLLLLFAGNLSHRELLGHLKINIRSSFHISHRIFSLAFAVGIVGGFLVAAVFSGQEKFIPKISISESQLDLIEKIVLKINPGLQNFYNMSIDEYIINQSGMSYNQLHNEIVKNEVLLSGKKNLSILLGHDVRGDEPMKKILMEILNKKINDYFFTGKNLLANKWLIVFVAFIAVYSVGIFITSLAIMLVVVLFKLLLWINLLQIDKKTVKMEVVR